jgi:polysaccharide export outer membrane protein
MNLRSAKRWSAGLLLFLLCTLASGLLAAQTSGNASASSLKPSAGSASPEAASSASKPHDSSFIIGNDDVLAINVWKEPDISRSIPVRSDGKISLPLVGEVQAAGLTPLALEKDIAEKLKNYIAEPEVTVMVQTVNSQKFNILGQVVRPCLTPSLWLVASAISPRKNRFMFSGREQAANPGCPLITSR